MKAYLINKSTRKNLGVIDFIPNKGDKIVHTTCGITSEYTVDSVVYQSNPSFSRVLVFVSKLTRPHLLGLIKSINW